MLEHQFPYAIGRFVTMIEHGREAKCMCQLRHVVTRLVHVAPTACSYQLGIRLPRRLKPQHESTVLRGASVKPACSCVELQKAGTGITVRASPFIV